MHEVRHACGWHMPLCMCSLVTQGRGTASTAACRLDRTQPLVVIDGMEAASPSVMPDSSHLVKIPYMEDTQRWLLPTVQQCHIIPATSGTAAPTIIQCTLICTQGQEGTATADIEFFEVMCNPNAHSSAFEAKAMITLRTTAGIKVNTEARVPSLQADVDAFVQSAQ